MSGSALTDRLAYSPDEAAVVLGLSRSTVYGLVRDGRLPAVKVGARTLIRREELDRLLSPSPDRIAAAADA